MTAHRTFRATGGTSREDRSAARALLDYGLTGAGLARVLSIRRIPNIASRRVMEKLGLRHEFDTVVRGTGMPVAVHATSADRARART